MILTKEAREKLQRAIHQELESSCGTSPNNDIFLVMSALISDFEELEKTLCDVCTTLASGKEINELLDSLSNAIPSDLIDKLNAKGQLYLIKNLSLLANNAQRLKLILAELHNKEHDIMQ